MHQRQGRLGIQNSGPLLSKAAFIFLLWKYLFSQFDPHLNFPPFTELEGIPKVYRGPLNLLMVSQALYSFLSLKSLDIENKQKKKSV